MEGLIHLAAPLPIAAALLQVIYQAWILSLFVIVNCG